MSTTAIDEFLIRYGAACSLGDLVGICAGWALPALVVSDQGALTVSSYEEVAVFFGSAIQQYRLLGLAVTRPRDVQVEPLSLQMASVGVTWDGLDAFGNVQMSERSRYILWQGLDGAWRIRVAMSTLF